MKVSVRVRKETLGPDHVPFNGLYERELWMEISSMCSIPFALPLLLGSSRIVIRAVSQ